MSYTEVTKTQSDLDVFNWIDSHVIPASAASNHQLIYDVVIDDLLAPVTPDTPDGMEHDKEVIITNNWNGRSQKFSYKLLMQWPDEALLEISRYLQVGIKAFDYYHPPSHAAPPVLVDGHDVSIKPFNPTPDSQGYLSNASDVYPVNYVWKDENGSYQKKEVGGWAFVTYYRWIKLDASSSRELSLTSDVELEHKIASLNKLLNSHDAQAKEQGQEQE